MQQQLRAAAAARAQPRALCAASTPHHLRRSRHAPAVTAAAGGRYGQTAGPGAFQTLPTIKVPLGASPNDPSTPLGMELEVLTPESAVQPSPVVVFTPGFLLNSSLYRSYAARLASWGFTVVLWDLSEVLDDTLTCAYMKQLLEVCGKHSQLRPHCDTSRLILAGHSRGAKLSCLIADQDARVMGLVLVDPVDNSSFGPQGVGYPSSLPALTAAAAARQLPVLVVGAALNTDVVPPEANWSRFSAAAAAGGAPLWELVLKGSAHLQFLDKQQPLFSLFSNSGPTPDATVRQMTQTAMIAFTKLAVCPDAPRSASQVQSLLAEEGAALGRLGPVACSFKNFSQLRTSSSPPGSYEQQQQQQASYRPPQPRSAGGGAAGPRAKPVQLSYAQLNSMRAKELKRLLQEHGVDSSDCFEKQELVARVLECCCSAASSSV